VTCKTDWFDLVEARLQIPPYSQPTMELAVAASRSPAGGLAAGRHGIGMLSIGGTSPAALARHKANWGLYEEAARENGHVPDRRNWRVVGLMHIAETREQAKQNCQFGLKAFARYFENVATFPIIPPEHMDDPYSFLVDSGNGCIGTPDDAIAYIERLVAETGGFGVIAELAHNWADWEPTKRHFELMARFVHPRFQRSREQLRDSYDFAARHHTDFLGKAGAAVQAEIDRYAARKAAEQQRPAAE
jgi:limonene 1,2-monooxygenase